MNKKLPINTFTIITIVLVIGLVIAFESGLITWEGTPVLFIIALVVIVPSAIDGLLQNAFQFSLINWLIYRVTGQGLPDPYAEIRRRIQDKAVVDWIEKHLEDQVLSHADFEVPLYSDGNRMVPPENLPHDDWIAKLFKQDARSQLIITGEAGLGKTVVLLRLLRHLLHKAENDRSEPVPIIIPLTAWNQVDLATVDFSDWVVDELFKRYDLPRTIRKNDVKGWLSRGIELKDIVFLFDGLDEMEVAHRQALWGHLYSFIEEDRARIAITSRIAEYEVLQLQQPIDCMQIEIRPLDVNDVRAYLSDGERNVELAGLRQKLEEDTALRGLAQIPFILYAMSVGFRGDRSSDIDITVTDPNTPPPELLRKYVRKQFVTASPTRTVELKANNNYRASKLSYGERYLSFLANKMSREGASEEFALESVRRDWLGSLVAESLYILVSRLLATILIVVSASFFLSGPFDYVIHAVLAGSVYAVLQLAQVRYGIFGKDIRQYAFMFIIASIVVAFMVGFIEPAPEEDLIINGLFSLSGMTLGVFICLFPGGVFLIHALVNRHRGEQLFSGGKPVMSVPGMLRGMAIGSIALAVIIGPIAHFLARQDSGSVRLWLDAAFLPIIGQTTPLLFGGLIGAFYGLLIGGAFGLFSIEPEEQQDFQRVYTKQGIQRQLENALTLGLQSGLAVGLLLGIVGYVVNMNNVEGFLRGIRTGLGVGLLVGVLFGGIDVLYYKTLQAFLVIRAQTPFRLISFMNYARRANLVRDVGQRYRFTHKHLLNYFAALDKPEYDYYDPRPTIAFSLVLLIAVFIGVGQRWMRLGGVPATSDDTLIVESQTTAMQNTPFCLEEGETVELITTGRIRLGNFAGYSPPEGSQIGLFGFSLSDAYDVVPQIEHSALMCRIEGVGEDWQTCAYSPDGIDIPWEERYGSFTATEAGCLTFRINGIEDEKRSGFYRVRVNSE